MAILYMQQAKDYMSAYYNSTLLANNNALPTQCKMKSKIKPKSEPL